MQVMDPQQVSASATVYLYLDGVVAFDPSSPDGAVDPTVLPVQMAFVASAATAAEEGQWRDAEWVGPTRVRILVGPVGGTVVPVGEWVVKIRVVGGVEQPEWTTGIVVVTP